jgi:pimeloyl-ACP methyl ester carboxylesterase
VHALRAAIGIVRHYKLFLIIVASRYLKVTGISLFRRLHLNLQRRPTHFCDVYRGDDAARCCAIASFTRFANLVRDSLLSRAIPYFIMHGRKETRNNPRAITSSSIGDVDSL